MLRVTALLFLIVVGCTIPAATPASHPPQSSSSHREAPSAGTSGHASPLRTATEEQAPRTMAPSVAKPFETSNLTAKPTFFRRNVWGAAPDRGARSVVAFGFIKSWLFTKGNFKAFPEGVYGASFSPSGSLVALVANTSFAVLDVATGKVLRRFDYRAGFTRSPQTKAIRIDDKGAVVYFNGCQLFRGNAKDTHPPKALSDVLCGRPIVSTAGHWFVWQQDFKNHETPVQVRRLSLENKTNSLVLSGVGNALIRVLISPNGRYLCALSKVVDTAVRCKDLDSNEEFLVWKGAIDYQAVFVNEDTLVFGAGARRSIRPLMLADLGAMQLREIGTLGTKEEWLFAVEGTRVAANGGDHLLLFDIEAEHSFVISVGPGEWEGLAAIPGLSREFILGKERKGTRDLYRLRLP